MPTCFYRDWPMVLPALLYMSVVLSSSYIPSSVVVSLWQLSLSIADIDGFTGSRVVVLLLHASSSTTLSSLALRYVTLSPSLPTLAFIHISASNSSGPLPYSATQLAPKRSKGPQ
ncbi:hypothetical protein BU26DRAFT_298425 [Trematosphaeria pertusa]|uniref:Uncharacterized protein n=1 Tax=Trematosphaeria pertusa TaxID=390896 RepID=A0A6A6IIL8_9PLEO|nr:uncharacterized protein BU26DRAFT_298425 [Trematosphaeria pertusa]KAF2250261.1 hypothetical protein BU26DRAFT_298425 [Trematosphaeria pertusa]